MAQITAAFVTDYARDGLTFAAGDVIEVSAADKNVPGKVACRAIINGELHRITSRALVAL